MRRNTHIVTAVMAITMALGCAGVAMAKDVVPAESKEVLLDNDQVRVLEVTRSPGTKVPMHTHPPGLLGYYFSAVKVKATLPDGKTKTMDLPAGKVFWYPNELTHAIEIMGTNDQHVLVIQLKQQDSSTMANQVRNIGKAPGICLSTQSENKCRVKSHERLTMQLPEERFIDNIVLSADDKFGEASNARVNVLLDGRQLAKDVDITERGAEHVFSPGTRGRVIEIVPANDGEVNIHWVRVYGY